MVADVAAVGDPRTGVAYYNGTWLSAGGTSVAAPIIAGIAGLYGITDPGWPYAHTNALFDVITGSNGNCGAGNYQCNAVVGFDGPTGLGTPNGALFPPIPSAMDGGRPGAGGAAGAGGSATGSGGAGVGAGGAGGRTGSGGSGVTAVGTGGAATGGGGDPTGGGGDPTASGGSPAGGAGTAPAGGGGSAETTVATTGTGVLPKANENDSGCSCRVGAGTAKGRSLVGLFVFALGLIGAGRRARRTPITS
jgi:MYXO-CTERM domain-containing protein